ncbi:uncharacterized protein LOC125869665 [Solanum stenotomum]|uniref:uncharacterized protein LOC125869665 n=1 Tax=Solanum stenotomum TaxID=172797 RepID=UPI0020D0911C|nr:uncharacterized protein LOC125869665 [Solanum stenotomum]
MEVEHLSRTGSDHAPMFLTCGDRLSRHKKPFRFLKFWTENPSFIEVVRQNWCSNWAQNPFLEFKANIKNVKSVLTKWSKDNYGDIFKKLIIREDIVKIKEKLFEEVPTTENREVLQRAQAEVKRYLHFEEIFWQKKAGYDWFENGDKITKFFHSMVKGRRKRLHLNRIRNSKGTWIEEEGEIATEAINFYNAQFRIEGYLPKLISFNQSDFVKGRRIIEKVLLTQEIVTEIRKRGKPANVVIKLDMAKAYDRVSWFYLMKVGVKQGDPLSPALFILSAEVLSRVLNALFEDGRFVGYGMPKWSTKINHLSYADDTIIFTSADRYSLKKIVSVLQDYETHSEQKINKEKSGFFMHQNAAATHKQLVEEYTCISRGQFPMKYLGCPISHAKKRKIHYADLIQKVKSRLHAWKELHRILAKFFWSNKVEGKSKHWAAWDKVCLPKQEGGLGFRSIFEVSKAMHAKLWWKFRTQNTVWANFMWNKYCKKQIPSLVQWKGGSQLWKNMLQNREVTEKFMWWKPKRVFIKETGWKYKEMQHHLPINVIDHVKQHLNHVRQSDEGDKPWWIKTSSGKFTVKSAWDVLRKREEINGILGPWIQVKQAMIKWWEAKKKMTNSSQANVGIVSATTTSIAHNRSTAASSLAEKPVKFSGVDFKRWATECRSPKKEKKKDQENFAESKEEMDDLCAMLS